MGLLGQWVNVFVILVDNAKLPFGGWYHLNSHQPGVIAEAPFCSNDFYSPSQGSGPVGNFVGDFPRCGLNWPPPAVTHARELKLDRNSFQAELPGFLHG